MKPTKELNEGARIERKAIMAHVRSRRRQLVDSGDVGQYVKGKIDMCTEDVEWISTRAARTRKAVGGVGRK